MINKGLGFLSLCFFATLGTAAHAVSCKGTSAPIRPVTKSAFFLNSVTNFNTTGNVRTINQDRQKRMRAASGIISLTRTTASAKSS